MALIQTHGLTKRYGAITALHDCHLQVAAGEVFGLLGPNGAGKTTLLRLLMGFLKPSSGWARIDGRDAYRDAVRTHRSVAYLPGDVRLFRSMRARQLLVFFARSRPGGNLQRACEIAERLELDVGGRVSRMSTGMRQKLALAATLAANTPLVILDEPTSNLDPNVRRRVARMIRELRAEGRTVLFSSHVLPEVEETCDRVAILRRGQVVHEMVMATLRRQHRIVAELTQPLPEIPREFHADLRIITSSAETVVMETAAELRPFLGWLASLPLRELRIEPVGLRAVYDRFHPPEEPLPGELIFNALPSGHTDPSAVHGRPC